MWLCHLLIMNLFTCVELANTPKTCVELGFDVFKGADVYKDQIPDLNLNIRSSFECCALCVSRDCTAFVYRTHDYKCYTTTKDNPYGNIKKNVDNRLISGIRRAIKTTVTVRPTSKSTKEMPERTEMPEGESTSTYYIIIGILLAVIGICVCGGVCYFTSSAQEQRIWNGKWESDIGGSSVSTTALFNNDVTCTTMDGSVLSKEQKDNTSSVNGPKNKKVSSLEKKNKKNPQRHVLENEL